MSGRTVAVWGSATSPGLVRTNNEDTVFAQFPVFLVADGMGGAAGGEVASRLAADAFRGLAGPRPVDVDEISVAIERANRAVIETGRATEGLAGMGTTLVGIALVRARSVTRWLAFNVGDSRLYRYHREALVQISRDHSEVQLLVDHGAITSEAARSHPHRHVITRAVGAGPTVEPDFWLLRPEAGERFVICSDGLTDEIDDAAVAGALAAGGEPTTAALRLVDLAVAAGGRDNVTVVVVDVLEAESDDPPPAATRR